MFSTQYSLEIETIEVTTIIAELVVLSAGVRKLRDYLIQYRRRIRIEQDKCHIPQRGTLYDRLRIISVLPQADSYHKPRRGDCANSKKMKVFD